MSRKLTSMVSTTEPGLDEAEFDGFVRRMQAQFEENIAASGNLLFRTDVGNDNSLFDAYLDALPKHRQYHTCYCCRRFIVEYGSLAVIDQQGRLLPAVWHVDDAPDFYRAAVETMAGMVRRSRVVGAFVSSETVYGNPVAGDWTHFALTPPRSLVFRESRLTAGQSAAEKLEDYRNIQRALAEFPLPMLEEAMRVLEADALYRAEKVIGSSRWLRDLHLARRGIRGQSSDNITWRAVASAPAGFCHPRSSMIGTLLEGIAAGNDFEAVSRRFAAKMHPLQYQRPQAAPSAQNIAEAEKLVAKLGIGPSLERRFARLEEVEAIWRPEADKPAEASGGVFSHIRPKGAAPAEGMTLPSKTMTWDKFSRTVLPTAQSMQFFAPRRRSSYAALLTAVNLDGPPILQWDLPEHRNPISWYVYNGGSSPEDWSLAAGAYHDVTAVTLSPAQWGPSPVTFAHQGEAVVLLLRGAVDQREAGNALFPETLKSDLRAIRATIERYSATAKIAGREAATACGIMFQKNQPWDARLKVLSNGSWSEYVIDRWD